VDPVGDADIIGRRRGIACGTWRRGDGADRTGNAGGCADIFVRGGRRACREWLAVTGGHAFRDIG
jgi:hypothetical protein